MLVCEIHLSNVLHQNSLLRQTCQACLRGVNLSKQPSCGKMVAINLRSRLDIKDTQRRTTRYSLDFIAGRGSHMFPLCQFACQGEYDGHVHCRIL
jgi:hypothetical protein